MTALSEHVLEEIRELPAKYPQHRSAVMPELLLREVERGHHGRALLRILRGELANLLQHVL